jgi:thioredoxin 1
MELIHMAVSPITSLHEFQTIINSDKPVIIHFWATWVGPCRVIAPIFEGLSNEAAFSGIGFYKVDVDAQTEISQEVGIRAMPTFGLFKDGKNIDEFIGANPAKLEDLVAEGRALV